MLPALTAGRFGARTFPARNGNHRNHPGGAGLPAAATCRQFRRPGPPSISSGVTYRDITDAEVTEIDRKMKTWQGATGNRLSGGPRHACSSRPSGEDAVGGRSPLARPPQRQAGSSRSAAVLPIALCARVAAAVCPVLGLGSRDRVCMGPVHGVCTRVTCRRAREGAPAQPGRSRASG